MDKESSTLKPLVSGLATILNNSYVAINVDPAAVSLTNAPLKEILGSRFEEMKANRDARDGAENYHITLITPREFRSLKKEAKADNRAFAISEDPLEFEILGIGTVANETSQAWFAVCRSEAAADWRRSLGLPIQDFHITLAFDAGGDVHNQSKSVDSLVKSI